jgi:thiamine monophosphate kinase
MAAVAMSAHGVAFKQGMSLGKSEFAGKVVKQSASSSAAAAAVPAFTFVSVRASGYDEELVKTAVGVSIFLSSSSAFHVFCFTLFLCFG